jgi:hypothetical protein
MDKLSITLGALTLILMDLCLWKAVQGRPESSIWIGLIILSSGVLLQAAASVVLDNE